MHKIYLRFLCALVVYSQLCSHDCDINKLGDQICDPQFNTLDYDFDRNDCGCAVGCQVADYGTCKRECLVSQCHYDQISPNEDFRCKNENLVLFYYYQHIISKGNLEYIPSLENCHKASDYQCTESKALDRAACHVECNIPECGYSWNLCNEEAKNICMDFYCSSCYDSNDKSCLICSDGYYNEEGRCRTSGLVKNCKPIFLFNSYICVGYSDYSSYENPYVYFATSKIDISNKGGAGSMYSPFQTLSYALYKITHSFSILYLIPDGEFDWAVIDPSLHTAGEFENPLYPLYMEYGKRIKITTLNGSIVKIKSRYGKYLISILGYSWEIELENLEIDGYEQDVSCQTGEYCDYCPYKFCNEDQCFNDRGEFLELYLNYDYCQQFSEAYTSLWVSSLIDVGFGSLTLTNVSFLNWRIGLLSIISSSGGNIFMSNVNFDNISNYDHEHGYAIQFINTFTQTGTFWYENGVVSRINNGFELWVPQNARGFFISDSIENFYIKNVTFTNNIVKIKNDSKQLYPYLLKICNIGNFTMVDCRFVNNYADGGIMMVIPKESSTVSSITLPTIISILNTTFESNYVKRNSVLYINLYNCPDYDVTLLSLIFEKNAAESSPLVSIGYSNTNGYNSIIIAHLEELMSILIQDLIFTENYVKLYGILELQNLTNIMILDSKFESNGSSLVDLNNLLVEKWINDPQMYVSLSVDKPQVLSCASLGFIKDSNHVQIDGLRFIKNNCQDYSPGLTLDNTKDLYMANSVFSSNTGSSLNGLCITVIGNSDFEIINSTFSYNFNTKFSGKGAFMHSRSSASLIFNNCEFFSNTADQGASIYFLGKNLYIKNCLFSDNRSQREYGGAIYYEPDLELGEAVIDIKFSKFFRNQASFRGGALYLQQTSSLAGNIEIFIKYSEFRDNRASAGSCIYIDKSVYVSSQSFIDSTVFDSNVALISGVISLYYIYGVLIISQCQFLNNEGFLSSVFHVDISDDNAFIQSRLIVNDSHFMKNQGKAVILADNSISFSSLYTNNCVFEENHGISVSLNYDFWVDRGSVFKNNLAESGTALYLQNSAFAQSFGTKFYNNTSFENGGAVTISIKSKFECYQCLFTANHAGVSGGVVFVQQNSEFYIKNSTFTLNSCQTKGSVAFLMGAYSTTSVLSDCEMNENDSNQEGTLVLLDSSLEIINSYIYKNTAALLTPGIILTLSKLYIDNSTISSQSGSKGSFIYSSSQSDILINNCSFIDGHSVYGGAFYLLFTNINVTKTNFFNIESENSGAIMINSDSSLNLSGCYFQNTTSKHSGSVINIYLSTINVKDTVFEQFQETAIYGDELKEIEIMNTVFRNGVGTAIKCTKCESLNFFEIEVSDVECSFGCGFYLASDVKIDRSYTISNSKFIKNRAYSGGAIFADNVDIKIKNNYFQENTAKNSYDLKLEKGGALRVLCSRGFDCRYDISSNLFISNEAGYSGGAIAWDDLMPSFNNNTFLTNSAVYGAEIASFPVRLKFSESNNDNRTVTTSDDKIFKIHDIVSGQNYKKLLSFELVDHLDNTVLTDNESTAEIKAVNVINTFISGNTKATASNGLFIFTDFTIIDTPGTITHLEIYSPRVLKTFVVEVLLRDCVVGEAKVKNTCEICPKYFYSLDPNDSACRSCPIEAVCYGNFTIVPKAGYWRDNQNSERFFACPNPISCKGSSEDEFSMTGNCALGYKGNLCQSCDVGFSRTTKNMCLKCPSDSENILKSTFVCVIIVIFFVVIIKATRKSTLQPKTFMSTFIKIFMNYLQLVALTTGLDFNWPSQVIYLFNIQANAGYVGENFYSFDCFLGGKFSNNDIYYAKLKLITIMPIAVGLLTLLIWVFIKVWAKSFNNFKNDFISTCIILLFLLHPNIIKSMFGAFSCREINPGENWLLDDLDIKCWDDQHTYYALCLALPSIIVWGIGLPTICLINLSRRKKSLNDINVRLKYGFLINGFMKEKFYWEFIILYRKIIIVSCVVFLTRLSASIQGLIVMLILILFLYVQYKNNPYVSHELNRMEIRSLLCSAITIYSGLFFLTSDLNRNSSIFFFVVIILGNIYFLYYWAYKTLWGIFKIVLEKWPIFRKSIGLRLINKNQILISESSFDANTQNHVHNEFNIGDGNMMDWFLSKIHPLDISAINPPSLSFISSLEDQDSVSDNSQQILEKNSTEDNLSKDVI